MQRAKLKVTGKTGLSGCWWFRGFRFLLALTSLTSRLKDEHRTGWIPGRNFLICSGVKWSLQRSCYSFLISLSSRQIDRTLRSRMQPWGGTPPAFLNTVFQYQVQSNSSNQNRIEVGFSRRFYKAVRFVSDQDNEKHGKALEWNSRVFVPDQISVVSLSGAAQTAWFRQAGPGRLSK